jgi:hypothetical protein
MNTIAILALLLVPVALSLPFLSNYFVRREIKRKTLNGKQSNKPPRSGYILLSVFTLIALAFGIFVLILYWDAVARNKDLIVFGIGLFIVMVIGMFVQVLIASYAERRAFSVTATQLIFPVLLSPIVFYVIWTTAASAPKGAFVIYCAFLNGYFWESTVSKVKPQGG